MTEWRTVSAGAEEEENKLVFDTIGDEFIGTYLGNRTIEPRDVTESSYQQARFRGEDNLVYFTNLNYSLRQGLKDVRVGKLTRITFVSELDTGQASPMKQFRVDVAASAPKITSGSENT